MLFLLLLSVRLRGYEAACHLLNILCIAESPITLSCAERITSTLLAAYSVDRRSVANFGSLIRYRLEQYQGCAFVSCNFWRATPLNRIFRHQNKRNAAFSRSWRVGLCLTEEAGVLCNKWPSNFFISADIPRHIVAVLFDWWSWFAVPLLCSARARTKNKETKTIDLILRDSYCLNPLAIAATDSDCLQRMFCRCH